MEVTIDVITLEEWLPKVDESQKCRGCGHIVKEFEDEKFQLCQSCIQLKSVFPTESELTESGVIRE